MYQCFFIPEAYRVTCHSRNITRLRSRANSCLLINIRELVYVNSTNCYTYFVSILQIYTRVSAFLMQRHLEVKPATSARTMVPKLRSWTPIVTAILVFTLFHLGKNRAWLLVLPQMVMGMFTAAVDASGCAAPSVGELTPVSGSTPGFQTTVPGVYTLQASVADGCQTFYDTRKCAHECSPNSIHVTSCPHPSYFSHRHPSFCDGGLPARCCRGPVR